MSIRVGKLRKGRSVKGKGNGKYDGADSDDEVSSIGNLSYDGKSNSEIMQLECSGEVERVEHGWVMEDNNQSNLTIGNVKSRTDPKDKKSTQNNNNHKNSRSKKSGSLLNRFLNSFGMGRADAKVDIVEDF